MTKATGHSEQLGGDSDDALALALVVQKLLGEAFHGLKAGLSQPLHAAVSQLVAQRWSQRRPNPPGSGTGKCRAEARQGFLRGGVVPVTHDGAGALGQKLYVFCSQPAQTAMGINSSVCSPRASTKPGFSGSKTAMWRISGCCKFSGNGVHGSKTLLLTKLFKLKSIGVSVPPCRLMTGFRLLYHRGS